MEFVSSYRFALRPPRITRASIFPSLHVSLEIVSSIIILDALTVRLACRRDSDGSERDRKKRRIVGKYHLFS